MLVGIRLLIGDTDSLTTAATAFYATGSTDEAPDEPTKSAVDRLQQSFFIAESLADSPSAFFCTAAYSSGMLANHSR